MTVTFISEWKKLNDFDINEDYICKLLNKFNIKRYNATINKYGYTDLCIEHNLKRYKVELNYDKCIANIHRGKMVYCSQKTSKEYMPIVKTFNNHAVWYDVLKWISKDL